MSAGTAVAPGGFGIAGTVRGSAAGPAVVRAAAPVGEPQFEQNRAALPYSSPHVSQVPPTPGWKTTASDRGAPSAASIASDSASSRESRSTFAPITVECAVTSPPAVRWTS